MFHRLVRNKERTWQGGTHLELCGSARARPLRVIDDRVWLRQFVEQLTNRYEGARSDPWKVTDAPADFIDTLTSAIVGIEIPISQLTGKWKVSQNRPEKDRLGVTEG